jgi:signal transduction histidine kinase
MSSYFAAHLTQIYFIYGLAFFVTGVVLLLEASRSFSQLGRQLPLLAAFGLIHGSHEWMEMFEIIAPSPVTTFSRVFRIILLAVSFGLLVEYGLRTLTLDGSRRWRATRWVVLIVFLVGIGLVWLTWGSSDEVWPAADVWCRYSLAIPGATLAALGLFKQSRTTSKAQPGTALNLAIVGLGFMLYGIPGQVFVTPSLLPPAIIINSTLFLVRVSYPVQLLRSAMASIVLVFTVRAVRQFEQQRQREVEDLNQARLEAQQQLHEETIKRERLRRQLLHQTVRAQERERRNIARELHDEAGQALTAISWGLAAVEETETDHPEEAKTRIAELRKLTERVMTEIRELIGRLRPAMLDELGLVATLISYADECSTRFSFPVTAEVVGARRRLPSEIEVTLYRIAQEAITNVAKHAQASQASIMLTFENGMVTLTVEDDGTGMDVPAAREAAARGEGWGLAGIHERVELVGGQLEIASTPEVGTRLTTIVPIPQQNQDNGGHETG